MNHSQALRLALDALGKFSIGYHVDAVQLNDLIATLEAAQQETITVQEAWEAAGGNPGIKATKEELITALQLLEKVCEEAALEQSRPVVVMDAPLLLNGQPLYTHPPIERTLTDEVIADLWHQNGGFHHHFARAVERWLKGEK